MQKPTATTTFTNVYRPRRRLLLLTAAAVLGSTLPTAYSFATPRGLAQYDCFSVTPSPFPTTQTCLYASEKSGDGLFTRAAKKVLPKRWTTSKEERKAEQARKELIKEVKVTKAVTPLLKGTAPLPVRMVRSLVAPIARVACRMQMAQQHTLDLMHKSLDKAGEFITSDGEAKAALGEPIMMEVPFSQSTSSSVHNGHTSHNIQAQFYVQGSRQRGVATMTASENGIHSLFLNVGGQNVNISLMKNFIKNDASGGASQTAPNTVPNTSPPHSHSHTHHSGTRHTQAAGGASHAHSQTHQSRTGHTEVPGRTSHAAPNTHSHTHHSGSRHTAGRSSHSVPHSHAHTHHSGTGHTDVRASHSAPHTHHHSGSGQHTHVSGRHSHSAPHVNSHTHHPGSRQHTNVSGRASHSAPHTHTHTHHPGHGRPSHSAPHSVPHTHHSGPGAHTKVSSHSGHTHHSGPGQQHTEVHPPHSASHTHFHTHHSGSQHTEVGSGRAHAPHTHTHHSGTHTEVPGGVPPRATHTYSQTHSDHSRSRHSEDSDPYREVHPEVTSPFGVGRNRINKNEVIDAEVVEVEVLD